MLKEASSDGASTAKYVFQWMVSQANVWYLLYRCAEYVNKANSPLYRSNTTALDRLLALHDSEFESEAPGHPGALMEGAEGAAALEEVENRQVPETSWWRSKFLLYIIN